MSFREFPEGLLCLCLRDAIDEDPAARIQGTLFCEWVPVFVGQRCLDHRAGKVHEGDNSSSEGDMFDTGGDSLADDVKRPFSGNLRKTGVSWRLESGQGGGPPRGYPWALHVRVWVSQRE